MTPLPPQRPLPLGLILFSLFIVVPVCELILLVWLTKVTSFALTLGVILLSALVGASLLRWQGTEVLRTLRGEVGKGKFPGDTILDGLMVLLAGGLMLTPGLLTDFVGLTMLIPATRRHLREGLKRVFRGRVHVAVGGFGQHGRGFGAPHTAQQPGAEVGSEEPPHQGPFREDSPFDRLKK